MRYQRLFWVFVLSGGLLLVLLVSLNTQQTALAATLCVTPGGGGGCYNSVQTAVDNAGDGDTIHVAAGTYYETVVLSKSVILEGGWNTDFSARDWDLYPTTLDAQRTGPVIWVNAPVSPTIEGFVITGGDDTAYLGWGGGIKIYRSGGIDVVGFTTIRHNVITNNIACTASTCQGHGGGIHVYRSNALIEYNTIISNAARTAGEGGGQGGGVRIWTANATLRGNIIVSNTAVYSTTGLWTGEGGGVGTEYAQSAILEDNEIRGNVAAIRGDGYGGGVWANAYMYGNRILSNTASVDNDGYGGGVYAYYVPDFNDNLVQGNVASQNGDGTGGGIYGIYLKTAQRNTVVGNIADRGGGIYMQEYTGNQALYYNLIAYNQATGPGTSTTDGGGGMVSLADKVEIVGNEFISNTAELFGLGGGLLITGGDQYLVRDNRFEDNLGGGGGAIAVYTATGSIVQNQLINNTALIGGGMYLWGQASPILDRNIVTGNTADGFVNGAGGGLLINVDDGTSITMTNHIIAQNAAGPGGYGGGVFCWRGDCVLINNTIVDNDRGDHKEGVMLGAGYGGTYIIQNNIIAGHSVGITQTGGTATLDYNNYYDNDTDIGGIASWGTHHRTDDPQFEDRLAGNYHLTLNSSLIDQGNGSVNITSDFEGDPRPLGSGIDIGADEAYRNESYVSELVGNDLTGDGSPGNPFATVTKAVLETQTGGTIYVGRGHYPERITITRSLELRGGYNENDWNRDIAVHTTTLDGQSLGTVISVYGETINATIEGFTITNGEATIYGSGGGIAIYNEAAATLRYNTITGNHAQNGGGGVLLWGSDTSAESVLDSNRIHDNSADGVFVILSENSLLHAQQGPEPGGGLLLGGGTARLINNWVYHNTAVAGGDGMAISSWDGPVWVYHNTVVDNGNDGVGIQIIGPSPQMTLHNNLIVGHGTAITATAEVATVWDYNGFYDNLTNFSSGLSGGEHDQYHNPYFVNRTGSNYHLQNCSPVAGMGLNVNILTDIDNDARPLPGSTGPDLGADEIEQQPCLSLYLPLLLKD